MTDHVTQLQAFVAEEVKKVKGISVPIRAGRLERALVRKVNCKKLHPNPDDEFSMPEIGPNAEIVARYEEAFRIIRANPGNASFVDTNAKEPVEVQKIHPDGYMLLNGHHRWAAAVRSGISHLPVHIVNLTQEKDIQRMLAHSRHNKRVSLDLEEVVFANEKDADTEKPLSFPFNRIYRERLRLGIPALFDFFIAKGYDIWLYSAGYMSTEYVQELLKLHHVHVTGIITGTARKLPKDSKAREKLETLMAGKYAHTIHADSASVLCIDSRTREFQEFPLKGNAVWPLEVMEIMESIGALDRHA